MLVRKTKRKSTVKIVGAINTVPLSECCHSYIRTYIIAPFGEKRKTFLKKCRLFCFENRSKNICFLPKGEYYGI